MEEVFSKTTIASATMLAKLPIEGPIARVAVKAHRHRLSDRILGAIVMHRQSGDDDHAMTRFDPQAAARIDDNGIRRRRRGQRQGLLGAHAPS